MSRKLKILKNFFSLTTADIANRLAGLIYLPYIARVFGPEGFGKVSFAESFVGYFMLAANFGFDIIGTREVAKYREKQNAFIHVLLIEIITSGVSFLLLCGSLFFLPQPQEIKVLIILYGLTLWTFAFTIDWFFLGMEWMGAVALVRMARQFCYIGLILLSIHAPEHLYRLPLSYVAADMAAVLIFFWIFFYKIRPKSFKVEMSSVRYLAQEAFPLGISNFLNSSRDKIGPVILGFTRTLSDVGFFSVGYKLLCVANIIPYTLNRAVFPDMTHALKNRTEEQARSYIKEVFRVVSIIAFPLAFLIFYNASFFVRLIFGHDFREGAGVLRIIIWSAGLLMFNKFYYYYMIAVGRQKMLFLCSLAGLIVNVGLCFVFVVAWGAQGAAAAFLVSELLVGFIYYFASGAQVAPGRELAMALLCFIPSFVLCFLFEGRLHSLVVTLFAAALYVAIVFKVYDVRSLFSEVTRRGGEGHDAETL